MIINRNPTISEINRYLKPLIEELLKKHCKVTNPDFEGELKERAGIGWKQVKNYRNHPTPHLHVAGNSKIQQFVAKARAKDIVYRSKIYLIYFISAALLVIIITATILGLIRLSQTPQINLTKVIDQRIDQKLKSNPCTKIVKERIDCPEGTYLFNK